MQAQFATLRCFQTAQSAHTRDGQAVLTKTVKAPDLTALPLNRSRYNFPAPNGA